MDFLATVGRRYDSQKNTVDNCAQSYVGNKMEPEDPSLTLFEVANRTSLTRPNIITWHTIRVLAFCAVFWSVIRLKLVSRRSVCGLWKAWQIRVAFCWSK